MAPLCNENVSRFDIAVNDALRVCCIERIGDFDCDRERSFNIHRTACDAVFQRQAIKKFHGDEAFAIVLANFINRADAGMV